MTHLSKCSSAAIYNIKDLEIEQRGQQSPGWEVIARPSLVVLQPFQGMAASLEWAG